MDPNLELSALADRVVAMGGPALLFETVIGSKMPVAVNLEILGAKLTLLQQTFSCQGRWSQLCRIRTGGRGPRHRGGRGLRAGTPRPESGHAAA